LQAVAAAASETVRAVRKDPSRLTARTTSQKIRDETTKNELLSRAGAGKIGRKFEQKAGQAVRPSYFASGRATPSWRGRS